jgi:hypothetical protein
VDQLPLSTKLIQIVLLFNWDWLLLILILYLAFRHPLIGDKWFRAIERFGRRIARNKMLAIIVLVVALVGSRALLLFFYPPPVPIINDEFSYLVAGDTFAHGRLANPPHPMWIFFDTFHVLQHPTYASMYPPAQGFTLALGEILGHPWIGVVLSMAAFFAALLWMLQGWFPSEWALLGAILVLLKLGVFSYWMNSYWGGAVAGLGGALVIGAVPRIFRKPRVRESLLMGVGVAMLANCRPLEGAFVCAPVAVAMAVWLFKRRKFSWSATLPRVVAPVAGVLLLTVGFMMYYNDRVTLNPLVMPHALDDQQHLSVSEFVWGERRPPMQYANHEFDGYYNHWTRNQYFRTWDDFQRITWKKYIDFQHFFVGAGLAIPFIAFPWLLLDHRPRLLLIQFISYCFGAITVSWFHPHYAAPIIATFFALIVQLFRHLRRWEYRGRPVGVGLTRGAVLLLALWLPVNTAILAEDPKSSLTLGWGWTGNWDRERVISQLDATPGNHLVIVRYSHDFHNIALEWVYNEADIDHAKIVWAREIPGTDIQPLLNYFKGRHVWIVEADLLHAHLEPYTGPAQLQKTAAAHVPWQ